MTSRIGSPENSSEPGQGGPSPTEKIAAGPRGSQGPEVKGASGAIERAVRGLEVRSISEREEILDLLAHVDQERTDEIGEKYREQQEFNKQLLSKYAALEQKVSDLQVFISVKMGIDPESVPRSQESSTSSPAEGGDYEAADPAAPVVNSGHSEGAPSDTIEPLGGDAASPDGANSEPSQDAEESNAPEQQPGQDFIIVDRQPEQQQPGQELVARSGQELATQQEGLTQLQERLEVAADRYAELSGKSRNGYIGRLLEPTTKGNFIARSGRFLAKITGIKKIAEKINEHTDAEIQTARQEYETAIDECKAALAETIKNQNPDAGAEIGKKIQFGTVALLSEINLVFEQKVAAERMADAKKTNAFVNFWVRQKGLGGKAVKALTVAAPGVGLGIAAGAFLVPVAGIALGAAAGLYIGHHVSRRRANAVGKDGQTLAENQATEDHQRTRTTLEAFKDRSVYKPVEETETGEEGGAENQAATQAGAAPRYETDREAIPSGRDTTLATEERTAREIQGNRARLKTAASVAGLAAGAAVLGPAGIAARARSIADRVTDVFNGDPVPKGSGKILGELPDTGAGESLQQPVEVPTATPPAEAVPTPEIFANDFTVEPGSGLIREFQEFAASNGHNLSLEQSQGLYEAVQQRFGAENIIDLKDYAQDVYARGGGDYGINAPGAANWRDGVAEFAKNWMTSQGL